MENNDSVQRLAALRKAYQELPEETKRQICRVVWKTAPDLFKHWSQAAKTGYHHHESAAARPAGVGRRLDDFLLKSKNGAWYVQRVATRFFLSEHWPWVERMVQGAKHETPRTVAAKADELLQAPDAPWLGNPLESYFRAASRLRPEDWLPDPQQPASPSTPPPKAALAPATPAVPPIAAAAEEPWQRAWRDFSAAETEAIRFYEAARNIQLFDAAAAAAAMAALERHGSNLRAALAEAAKAAREPVPEWQTAAQLKDHLARLTVVRQAFTVTGLRDRLLAIAVQIEGLVDIGSKITRKKERVEETRLAACAELRRKAAGEQPAVLPGSDADWLRATFALAPDALNQRLSDLRVAEFTQMAFFIEEAEGWDRFSTTEEGGSISTSPAPAAPIPPVPPAKPAPVAESQPTVITTVLVPAQIAPATPAEPVVPKLPVPVSAPPKPASAPPPVSTPEEDVPSGFNQCVRTLVEWDELEEARVLLADVVACQPLEVQEQLPAEELWRVLAMQPWLRQPESETPELVRTEFSRLLGADWSARTEAEAVVGWAALIYPSLLGQTKTPIFDLAQNNLLPATLGNITRLTATFLAKVPHCSPDRIASGTLHSSWQETLARYRFELVQFCDAAALQTINYQKATAIWRKMNGPAGRLREMAQKAQGRLYTETLQRLRADAGELDDLKQRQRLIESVGQALGGNYTGIDGAAFEQLSDRIADFAGRVERLCEHAAREPNDSAYVADKVQEFSAEALPLLRKFVQSPNGHDGTPLLQLASRIAQRAARDILALFEAKPPAIPPGHSFAQVQATARLRVASLRLDPRTGGIYPQQLTEEVRDALRRANFLSIADSLKRRLQVGDIANARRLRDQPGFDDASADWTGIFEDARARHAQQCRKDLEETRRDVLNARTLSVLTDSKAQDHLTGLAAAQKAIQDSEDYWTAHRGIAAIKLGLDEVMFAEAAKLAAELDALPMHPSEVRDRFKILLGSGDLATAREYLTRLKSGQGLPPMGLEAPLGGFTQEEQTRISAALRQAGEFDGFISQVRKGAFGGKKFNQLPAAEQKEFTDWLNAWRSLRGTSGLSRDMVLRWLHGVGFRPLEFKAAGGKHQFSADVVVETVTDRHVCAVPQFGSEAAGSYRLVHLASKQDPSQLLQQIEQAGSSIPVILLATFRVESRMRLEFARLCREKRRRALLVDDILMVFLAELEGDRLRACFRATLPYTWVDPYVPTSSFVPPEIFFGRIDALDALLDPAKQRCFVYGGRQLGKTALLREVERRFPQQHPGGVALWIDLQAEDFGQSAEPEEIWNLLRDRFSERVPGFEAIARDLKGAPSARVEVALEKWLVANPKRRLLLLLDEGDKFLDRDAVNEFAETRRLKGLMDKTGRRFKVVFAGLHNVQRSTRQANHPLAHLGDPVNIGAFTQNGEWMEAYALVAGPLATLGYRFASVDLPSRVLAACNFYPSLLQHFGHRLLERFRREPCREIPQVIDAEAIDDVLREDEFRRFMTDRFQLTLQLDRRYYYIAYGFAIFFHEAPSKAGQGYTPAEIRKEMEYWRPIEFASLGHEEFESLLDEMQGLGLLQKGNEDQKYRLRNTNVLLLLGTSDEVLRRISEDIPDLRLDYNSGTSRGRTSGNRRRWLTRPEENRLFGREHRFTLMSSSPLGESAGLIESITAGVGRQSFHLLDVASEDKLKAELENLANEKLADGAHAVLIEPAAGLALSYGGCVAVGRQFAGTRKSTARFFSVILHIPVGRLWEPDVQSWLAEPGLHGAFARRWEPEFVAPWLQDQTFQVTMQDVNELVQLTDGWPRLMHDFVVELKNHRNSWPEAIELIRRKLQRWQAEPDMAEKFFGSGPAAAAAWKHFREFHGLESVSFSSADLTSYADLQGLSASLMQHWVDVACRLDLLQRTPNTYRWTPLLGRVLSGQ